MLITTSGAQNPERLQEFLQRYNVCIEFCQAKLLCVLFNFYKILLQCWFFVMMRIFFSFLVLFYLILIFYFFAFVFQCLGLV